MCQLHAWLPRELGEDVAAAFVEGRGQAEGRKDAESRLDLIISYDNDTLLKRHLDFHFWRVGYEFALFSGGRSRVRERADVSPQSGYKWCPSE